MYCSEARFDVVCVAQCWRRLTPVSGAQTVLWVLGLATTHRCKEAFESRLKRICSSAPACTMPSWRVEAQGYWIAAGSHAGRLSNHLPTWISFVSVVAPMRRRSTPMCAFRHPPFEEAVATMLNIVEKSRRGG